MKVGSETHLGEDWNNRHEARQLVHVGQIFISQTLRANEVHARIKPCVGVTGHWALAIRVLFHLQVVVQGLFYH